MKGAATRAEEVQIFHRTRRRRLYHEPLDRWTSCQRSWPRSQYCWAERNWRNKRLPTLECWLIKGGVKGAGVAGGGPRGVPGCRNNSGGVAGAPPGLHKLCKNGAFQKNKKTCFLCFWRKTCFLCFFEGLWLEKITKKQKNTSLFLHFKKKTRNTKQKFLLRLYKPKSLFKVLFLFFLFWGFEVLGILSFSTYYKLSDIPR